MSSLSVSPIHVVGVLAGLALLYRSVTLVRARTESVGAFLLWAGFGVGLLVFTIGSAITTIDMLESVAGLLGLLGFNIGLDGVLLSANLLLLFLIFYAYTTMAENRRQLYDLTQDVALLRYELDQSRSRGEPESDGTDD